MDATEAIQLADYRRRVAGIYARVRDLGCNQASWSEWRARRDELFRAHPQSPIPERQRSSFSGLTYFHYDPYYRIEAEVEPHDGPLLNMAHSGDGSTGFMPVGRVVLSGLGIGETLTLYWLDAYGGGLFLPFADATSRDAARSSGAASSEATTYGGGRYLLDTAKGADLGSRRGRLILDFNFAYHPSCVYSDQWSCPLSPITNRLSIDIGSGECLGRNTQPRAKKTTAAIPQANPAP